MDSTQGKSRTKLVVGVIGVVVVLMIVGGAVYALVRAGDNGKPQQETQKTTDTETKSSRNVTQQTLSQDMNDLDAAIKQNKQYHDQAKAAVEDPSKQVKVSQ
jgi:uncharacterized protein YlxW (UPF0749 family)